MLRSHQHRTTLQIRILRTWKRKLSGRVIFRRYLGYSNSINNNNNNKTLNHCSNSVFMHRSVNHCHALCDVPPKPGFPRKQHLDERRQTTPYVMSVCYILIANCPWVIFRWLKALLSEFKVLLRDNLYPDVTYLWSFGMFIRRWRKITVYFKLAVRECVYFHYFPSSFRDSCWMTGKNIKVM